MPNIASVLKEEIIRLARKELRSETEKLKKASAQYRSEIAALKRRIAALEQQQMRRGKMSDKPMVPEASEAPMNRVRFSAKGLRAQRQRLELSAADVALLLGVSPQTIYNWEAETTRPRERDMAAIVALRGLGKREAAMHLKTLAAQREQPAVS